jgi:hypothetical protein
MLLEGSGNLDNKFSSKGKFGSDIFSWKTAKLELEPSK